MHRKRGRFKTPTRIKTVSPYHFFSSQKHLFSRKKRLLAAHILDRLKRPSEQPDEDGTFCLNNCWFSQVPKAIDSVVFRIDTRTDTVYCVGIYTKDGFRHAVEQISFPLKQ